MEKRNQGLGGLSLGGDREDPGAAASDAAGCLHYRVAFGAAQLRFSVSIHIPKASSRGSEDSSCALHPVQAESAVPGHIAG